MPRIGNIATWVGVANSVLVQNFLAAGDGQPAFYITGNGQLNWGPGGSSAVDVFLDRSSAGTLRTTGRHIFTNGITIPVYTSLPASPADGHMIVYQADAANGIYWWLRYNGGSSSPYKWEFLGGPPLLAEVFTAEGYGAGAYADLATVGPSITIPRSGDYLAQFGATITATANERAYTTLKLGSAASGDNECFITDISTAGHFHTDSRAEKLAGRVASDLIKMQYHLTAGGGTIATWSRRWLSILPIRVS